MHLAIRVEAGPVPVDERANRHGVAQVMQAGTRAATAGRLPFPQANLLADPGEAAFRRGDPDSTSALPPEERRGLGARTIRSRNDR